VFKAKRTEDAPFVIPMLSFKMQMRGKSPAGISRFCYQVALFDIGSPFDLHSAEVKV
jgi:hypothetical protein